MESLSELVKLVRFAVRRTDRTLRLCLILFCLAPATAGLMYLMGVTLPEVMGR
ncbi:hypothetical protein ACQEVZ_24575 [Dactylosporangium sp. CA-152071]|uniref:hypothetical protein n=1 Tax=Dactylosporangium sp. CA-152071 TaxID=3239933 RepID=UPI003D94F260